MSSLFSSPSDARRARPLAPSPSAPVRPDVPGRPGTHPPRSDGAEGADLRPLSERVAASIRGAILSGELPTGQPLRQMELATRFGVSPIPLREALRQLEAERLVVLHPYRGAVVAPLSRQEAEQTGEMVLALGAFAIRCVVPRLKPETLDRADAILEAMKAEADPVRWEALSQKLYGVLCEPAGRPYLAETIQGLLAKAGRYRTIALERPAYREEANVRHSALVTAGRRGDSQAAVKVLEELVGVTVREVSRHVPSRPGVEAPGGGRRSTSR